MMTDVQIKLLCDGCMPQRAHESDACYDLVAAEHVTVWPGKTAMISLGFALQLPRGWEAQIRGRSGLNSKGIIALFGTIDSGYRGEIKAVLLNTTDTAFTVDKGMRVSQMAIREVPFTKLIPVQELGDSDRGSAGFGSTGLNTPLKG
jgi:dUTP pyrophosphatase